MAQIPEKFNDISELTNPCNEVTLPKESTMTISKQTPILDLPIIVKGVDIRSTDVDSLIFLLSNLKEEKEKYSGLEATKFVAKVVRKIDQAHKLLVRELDKREVE